MCVICSSEIGVRQPTPDELFQMYRHNPHGAGFMYADGGRVVIRKGFMSFDAFLDAVEHYSFSEDVAVVYHFRIATQGAVGPAMCHPFPLSSRLQDMRLTKCACQIGVAHNGIISLTSNPRDKVYSDTAHFVAEYLAQLIRSPDDLFDPILTRTIYRLARSKFAVMDSDGNVFHIGEFYDQDGLTVSNTNHLQFTW